MLQICYGKVSSSGLLNLKPSIKHLLSGFQGRAIFLCWQPGSALSPALVGLGGCEQHLPPPGCGRLEEGCVPSRLERWGGQSDSLISGDWPERARTWCRGWMFNVAKVSGGLVCNSCSVKMPDFRVCSKRKGRGWRDDRF